MAKNDLTNKQIKCLAKELDRGNSIICYNWNIQEIIDRAILRKLKRGVDPKNFIFSIAPIGACVVKISVR